MPALNVLMGDTTVEATNYSTVAEKVKYHRVECQHTGTLEELQIYIQEALLSEIELGIYSDSSEAPGELLAQGKSASKLWKEEWVPVTGLSVAVTAGTFYWLAWVDEKKETKAKSLTGTAKHTRKGTTAEKTLKTSPTVSALETPE